MSCTASITVMIVIETNALRSPDRVNIGTDGCIYVSRWMDPKTLCQLTCLFTYTAPCLTSLLNKLFKTLSLSFCISYGASKGALIKLDQYNVMLNICKYYIHK